MFSVAGMRAVPRAATRTHRPSSLRAPIRAPAAEGA